jgi:S-methylmethionine-dependent homocysteine/selenocysteine methylase
MKALIEKNNLILIEAAIVERLRRVGQVELHPSLVHATFIYDDIGKTELEKLYRGYISIALEAEVPILLITPTWRANYERVKNAEVSSSINADAVSFMLDLRESYGSDASMIKIGGVVGCKNDCYKPEEGLTKSESETFHSWQINHLAKAGVDYLLATTLPNVLEAIGIADAMQKTGVPYIISFVIDRNGLVLDGVGLWDAISQIDSEKSDQPLCYMVNCSYPTFLHAEEQPRELFTRLLGFQANSSSLSHSDLEGSAELHSEEISEWTYDMLKLNREYGVKILGGCCGTDDTHLHSLTKRTLVNNSMKWTPNSSENSN